MRRARRLLVALVLVELAAPLVLAGIARRRDRATADTLRAPRVKVPEQLTDEECARLFEAIAVNEAHRSLDAAGFPSVTTKRYRR